MRLLLTILLSPFFASATNYYVSNAGSDAAGGTSSVTPWQTLAKVNAFSFSAGDSVFFRRGDTWVEKLIPPTAGIYFGAYGSGVKPAITALKTTTSFSQSGSVWTTTLTDGVAYQKVILVNGELRGKARYPNATLLTPPVAPAKTYLKTGNSTNYVGAELVIKTQEWVTDTRTITSQNSDTLFYRALTYTPVFTSNQYFLQNHASFLDQPGEWVYDSTTRQLQVYSATLPSVQYSTLDTLVWIKKAGITLDNLLIEGGNSVNLLFDTARAITVRNCTIRYNGGYEGVNPFISGGAAMLRESKACLFENDSLVNNLNNGIMGYYNSDSLTVSGCYFKNTGMIDGLGASGEGAGIGMYLVGNSTSIYHNRMDSTGYNAVYFQGTGSQVTYNYITNFCFQKSDGAGIYTYGSRPASPLSLVRKNIVIGSKSARPTTMAMYFDLNSDNILCDSNTFAYGRYHTTLTFAPHYLTFRENTVVDSTAEPFYYGPGGSGSNFTIRKNIFYQKDTAKATYFSAYTSGLPGSLIDSNYHLRPRNETNVFWAVNGYNRYTPAEWAALTGWDTHAFTSPESRTSNETLFLYNPTLQDSTVTLSGTYMTPQGAVQNYSATLPPFASMVLFKIADIPFQIRSFKFRYKKVK